MTQGEKQVGGGKEAGLGSSGVALNQQYARIYTPDNPEFHYYAELLRGFFEKLSRWQEILDQFEERRDNMWRRFSVYITASGLTFSPGMAWLGDYPPKVLRVSNNTRGYYPEARIGISDFLIRPGRAGKYLFTDPEDGKPLEVVTIHVNDQTIVPWGSKRIEIETEREGEIPGGRYNYREASYRLEQDGTLEVSRWYGGMTDKMAADLLDTIDSLIPNTTSLTPQTENRATSEPLPALPSPRRPAGQ